MWGKHWHPIILLSKTYLKKERKARMLVIIFNLLVCWLRLVKLKYNRNWEISLSYQVSDHRIFPGFLRILEWLSDWICSIHSQIVLWKSLFWFLKLNLFINLKKIISWREPISWRKTLEELYFLKKLVRAMRTYLQWRNFSERSFPVHTVHIKNYLRINKFFILCIKSLMSNSH